MGRPCPSLLYCSRKWQSQRRSGGSYWRAKKEAACGRVGDYVRRAKLVSFIYHACSRHKGQKLTAKRQNTLGCFHGRTQDVIVSREDGDQLWNMRVTKGSEADAKRKGGETYVAAVHKLGGRKSAYPQSNELLKLLMTFFIYA
jgi:hypothetical protein